MPPPEEDGKRFPELWDPALLLTSFWLEPVGEAEHRGRPAIRVHTTKRDSGDDYGRLGVIGDHELLIDVERGIALRAESLGPDHRAIWDVVEVAFDATPGEADDVPPPPGGTAELLELLYTAKRRYSTIRAKIGAREPPRYRERAEVWFQSRWRWRCERETREGREDEIANEDRFWRVRDGKLDEYETEARRGLRIWWEVPHEELWDGAHLIPGLWFEEQGREALNDRELLRIRVVPRATDQYWQPGFFDGVEDGELLVDAETGFIRHLDVRGDLFSTIVKDLLAVELDPELPPELFVYPEGEQ